MALQQIVAGVPSLSLRYTQAHFSRKMREIYGLTKKQIRLFDPVAFWR
jgi:hypothetical protein